MTVVSLRRSRGGRRRARRRDPRRGRRRRRRGRASAWRAGDGSDVAASKRPCLNPASKRPYERPSLTEVNSADPEDDAELICRPKKSPAKRQRVTP